MRVHVHPSWACGALEFKATNPKPRHVVWSGWYGDSATLHIYLHSRLPKNQKEETRLDSNPRLQQNHKKNHYSPQTFLWFDNPWIGDRAICSWLICSGSSWSIEQCYGIYTPWYVHRSEMICCCFIESTGPTLDRTPMTGSIVYV